MGSTRRAAILMLAVLGTTPGVTAQDPDAARGAYFRAVARYFDLPSSEIAILSDWEIAPDEIPVVLFIARQAGVSPEALVALRGAGRTWSDLSLQYGIGAQTLHVPVRDQVPAGTLAALYVRYRDTPVGEWRTIRLDDSDIIALVNVRLLAQALGLSAEEVLRQTGSAPTFVELYAQLVR